MSYPKEKNAVDMLNPPYLKKLLAFSLPLMASGVLQLLYNSADLIVVGHLSEIASRAQAAISSTASVVHLIVNVFMGFAVGINVAVANRLGARDDDGVSRAVHTAILLAVISGLIVGISGFIFSKPLLILMQSPEEVLPLSTLYLKIYFIGAPFNLLYNFGAAILRAKGETKMPLIFLAISGAVNVLLNLFFVTVFKMDVDGVAIATVVSQVLSATFVFIYLLREKSACRVEMKKLKISVDSLLEIIRIGLPAGVQASMFSISNVIIQSSINSFGETVMAGNGNASSIEGYINLSVEAVHQAAVAFIAQNYGAKRKKNIYRIMNETFFVMTAVSLIISFFVIVLRRPLLLIFSPDPDVAEAGELRMLINVVFYFAFGWMQLFVSYLRGTGKSLLPMIISVVGVCLFRVFWIFAVLPVFDDLVCLYLSYPVSWALTAAAQLVAFFITKKKTFEGFSPEQT